MRLLKSNPSGRLFLVSLMVIMACLLIPGAFASATADQINDKGWGTGPIVNFSVSPTTSISVGDTVQFYQLSNSTTAVKSVLWDFGDGSTSTETNATHVFASVGTFYVNLSVENQTGLATSGSGHVIGSESYTLPTITVNDVVLPDSKLNVTLDGVEIRAYNGADITSKVSVGDALKFYDRSTGGAATSWSWNFGDASSLVTTQNATHTFTAVGTYPVLFTPSNSKGAGTVVLLNITVGSVQLAVSNFSATANGETKTAQVATNLSTLSFIDDDTVLNGTAPMQVTFADLSTKSPSKWLWNFTADTATNVSILQNPTFTFAAGKYLIVMNASNAQGGSDSYLWVNVSGAQTPVVEIDVEESTTTGASPLTVKFNATWPAETASNKIPSTFLWNFGDGTQGSTDRNVTHEFTTTNAVGVNYNVTLVGINGAGNSITVYTPVHVTKAVAAVTNFSINNTETANSGTRSALIDGTLVIGQPVNFNDTSVNGSTTYSWIFSDGKSGSSDKNVVRNFDSPGIYWVYHTATNSVGGDYKLNLFEVLKAADVPTVGIPYAAFMPVEGTSAEGPVTVTFYNVTTNAKPDTFLWLINGQQAGTSENLTYTFPGVTVDTTYSVTLITATSAGSTSAVHSYIVKAPTGKAPSNFTYEAPYGLATPAQVQFTYVGGNATSFLWNFDDGTTSAEMNPQHTFNNIGNYSVKLTATNLAGSNSTTRFIQTTDLEPPVAKFTANNENIIGLDAFDASGRLSTAPAPYTVNFTGPADSRISAWYWDLGDGTTSVERNISHTYTTAGKYSVYLVVANTLGYDYVYAQNLVNATAAKPVADFTANPSTGSAPLTVQFTDKTTNSPFIWAWNFGDGTISGAQHPTHTYTAAKDNYTVTLIAQNAAGQSLAKTMNITVNSLTKPVSNFTFAPATGLAPLTVQFTDTSTNSPSSWSWTFTDDTSTSNVPDPVHIFQNAGTFWVLMTATNGAGAGQLNMQMITVTSPTPTPTVVTPVADFTATPSSGAAPLSVQFADKSTNADQWIWNFGDEATSTLQNPPAHTYTTAGTYTVQLQAVNSTSSKSTTKSMTITVTPPPQTLQAAFNVNAQAVQVGAPVVCTDASTGTPAAWSWDFGDGFTALTQNPTHAYSAVGSYTLSLTVTNGIQTSTASKTITVTAVPGPTPTITVAPGQPYNGPHNAPGTIQAEDYDLGGNNVAYYDTTTGNAGGVYRTDDVDIENGATGKAVAYVVSSEYLTYAVDAATAGDYTITINAANPDATAKQVQFTTIGNSATTVSVSSTGSFDTYRTFTSAGTLNLAAGRNIVKVTFGASRMNLDYITFGAGAQPTPTVTVTITPTPTVTQVAGDASFTVSPTTGKRSLTVVLTDTTTGGNPVSWRWSCGNGQSFMGKSIGLNRIWYNNAGTYKINLLVTDADGSVRTATQYIVVTN